MGAWYAPKESDLGIAPIEMDWKAKAARSRPTTDLRILEENLLVMGLDSTGPSEREQV